ncbi:hypothetical protein [Yersinia wautersii]|uniref:hypothetical protein n=1 Tax=Yersinia wautersii TaxID=1341643 RepID=UPI0003F8D0D7|nr:hypothetical protein [Yersinia wautersii]
MNNNTGILEQQIIDQLLRKTDVKVFFNNVQGVSVEYISLYQLSDNVCAIKVPFFSTRKITQAQYDDLILQFTDEQKFNTDREVIRSELGYYSFMDAYFNNGVPYGK